MTSSRDEDVLQLTDDDMILSTPTKRAMEDEDQEVKAKKQKSSSVDVVDLSETTILKLADGVQKVAEQGIRSKIITEKRESKKRGESGG